MLNIPLKEKTYAYGKAFEHFVILEIFRLNEYHKSDFQLSYLKTKDGAEIDLIIERPGKIELIIEIKSTTQIQLEDTKVLSAFKASWKGEADTLVLSNDPSNKIVNGIECSFWKDAIIQLFTTHK